MAQKKVHDNSLHRR